MATKTAMVKAAPAKPKKQYTQTEMACTDDQLAAIMKTFASDRPYTILAKQWTGMFCEWTLLFLGDSSPSHVVHIGDKWVIRPAQ
jgi:hypothetical protein